MDKISNILAVPFGWVLGFLYDCGIGYIISMVILTLIVRIILLPSSVKQQKNSAKQLRLQPKVNKIRAKYAGGDREAQMKISQETQELYKKEGFSATASGCLPLLLQFPVMMGLYGAIYAPISRVMRIPADVVTKLTELVGAGTASNKIELTILSKIGDIKDAALADGVSAEIINKIVAFKDDFTLFNLDLTQTPKDFGLKNVYIIFPLLCFVTSMLTSLFMYLKQRKTNPEMAKNPMMGCMTFLSPLMMVWFAWGFPAGVGVYWIISGIISFIQTIVLNFAYSPSKSIASQMIDETVARRSREISIKKTAEYLKNN